MMEATWKKEYRMGGMPLFDSCIHAFGSAGTGGFSNKNLSVGAYDSTYFDVVIGIFMLLFGAQSGWW